jgi:hypothetical protein
MASKEKIWGIGLMLLSVALAIFVGKVAGAIFGVGGLVLIVWAQWPKRKKLDTTRPVVSLEVPGEIHRFDPPGTRYFFVRSSAFIRNVRFDPIESRRGAKIWVDGAASLAPTERVALGFRVGDQADYNGVIGHLVEFFEEGSSVVDQPPYRINVRFLDGVEERVEQYTIEGHPLSKGGVRLEAYPSTPEKSESKKAREAIGRVLERLAQCERRAYDGSNADEYHKLLRQIDEIKRTIREIASRHLDSSFESRFLAVNVLDTQLDEATKMHFISRAQGSFWTVYQQIKGWRAFLDRFLSEPAH